MTGPQEPSLTPSDPVDFSALIMGFSSAALYYMGVAPVAGKIATTNFPLARQNIDIIKMLSDKTRGNLTPEEVSLIQRLIADLQLKWLEATK